MPQANVLGNSGGVLRPRLVSHIVRGHDITKMDGKQEMQMRRKSRRGGSVTHSLPCRLEALDASCKWWLPSAHRVSLQTGIGRESKDRPSCVWIDRKAESWMLSMDDHRWLMSSSQDCPVELRVRHLDHRRIAVDSGQSVTEVNRPVGSRQHIHDLRVRGYAILLA